LQSWGALQQRTGSIFVQSCGVGRDGVIFPTEVSSRTIALGGETVVLVQVRNITDRRRLEEQLRQAHKMEAVGRLAGGIAHEFNNLLTVINGYSEFLLRSLDPAGETYLDIEQIYTAGRRAAELTRQLLAFSRRQALARPLVDVNAVISEMGDLLRSMASENVHLTIRLAPDLGLTRGDRGQIEQAIVHLAMNARDAMPHGGELTLCTANVTLRPGDHVSHLDPRPGEYICLAVGDTGVGMPAEVCEHLFEPFFTTKEVGQGTGLGLAMIYGVIDDLGGAIDVCSEPGRGSTFRLYLPRAAMPAGEPALEGDALPRGHETVLVVEDEDAPRRRLARLLCRLGYTVLEAANCIEALRAGDRERVETYRAMLAAGLAPEWSGRRVFGADWCPAARAEEGVPA
jgi:signal transduction histidine kinase